MPPRRKRRLCVDAHRVNGRFARRSSLDLPGNEVELNSHTALLNFIQVTPAHNLLRARVQPPLVLSIRGVHFRLIFAQLRNLFFYGNKLCDIWSSVSFEASSITPVECLQKQFGLFRNDWRTLIYERFETDIVQSANSELLKSIKGQNLISLSAHNRVLCIDSPENGYICQFDLSCKNKSAWRCHFPACETAVCRKHVQSIVNPTALSANPGKRLPPSSRVPTDLSSNITAQNTVKVPPTNDFCPFDEQKSYFEGPFAAGIEINDYNDNTDSGAKPVWSSMGKLSSTIGSCVLLKGVGNNLRRSRRPISLANGQWRQIQKFVASVPGTSNVVQYPEAMVRPSLFPKFMGNALAGAVPSILLGGSKVNSSYNFAGIIEHILNFDTYLNHQLNHQDVRFIISRGLPELANVGDFSHDRVRMKLEEEDGRRLISERSAAFRTKNSSILLTFTLNQSAMFGVKPLFDIIHEHT